MPVVSAVNLSKSFGAQDLFSGVTCAVPHAGRVALVGPNGTGKTTLLRMLAGLEEPTSGQVHRMRGLTIGYLPQQAEEHLNSDRSIFDEMLTVFSDLRAQAAELRRLEEAMAKPAQRDAALERYGALVEKFEYAGGYTYETRIRQTLSGVGFAPQDFARPVNQLSGGQKTRALLAKLVLQEPGLLLLDEPTNHLDIEAVEWLEAALADFPGAVVVVAHDRYLLDAVAQTIWELDRGTLETYSGNYTQYAAVRAEQQERKQIEYERQQDIIAKEEEFIRRNMAGQKTRQAQGRAKRLERLERVERPHGQKAIKLNLRAGLRSGEIVLAARDLVVGYAGDEPLLTCESLELRRRQRVALWGPNGAGKTTFLKTVLGQLQPMSGEVMLGASIKVGYLAQTHDALQLDRSILDTVLDVRNMPVEQARGLMGRYLFTGDDVFKPIGLLSGGEKSRVALAVLTLQGANFLLLDEPTNHLDLQSQEVLQDVLSEFAGTILLVSHDRYLVDRLATHLWAIQDRQLAIYEGGYTQYMAQKAKDAERSKQQAKDAGKQRDTEARRASEERQAQNLARNSRRAREKQVAELESNIAALETRLQQLSHELEIAGVSSAVTRVNELGREYAQVEQQLHEQLSEWSQVVEHQT
jgi:ATP-binding cassette, subfamily F, member 3